jgi:putative transposase
LAELSGHTPQNANAITIDQQRIQLLEKQLKQAQRDNEILKKAAAFLRSLKAERLNNITFINHPSVVNEIESYIRFYNYKRRHSSIEYMTPYQKYNKLKNVA